MKKLIILSSLFFAGAFYVSAQNKEVVKETPTETVATTPKAMKHDCSKPAESACCSKKTSSANAVSKKKSKSCSKESGKSCCQKKSTEAIKKEE